ncbi:PREDICTED: nucleolar protein 14 homolog [Polistes dominula]|uniref:Nucleolar protein 14 homolog n=1 Tax=Polistes dominula TaxID=743375 RepID=A0ABM1IME0_POLDO|nr:PREDICTED: nucleolar protein 14 homolog [Polistes dominula]
MVKTKKKNCKYVEPKPIQQKKKNLNPFEIHLNKDKQNVLGRKSKADRGLPGISRAKAISKRKGTLFQEYKLKNKDNVFLDKRIGEKNYRLTPEEKAMARFTAERMKAHKKKNIFSLNDEEVLTHRGQTLEEIEKFDDPKSDDEFSDDENKDGKLDKKFVGEAHFGGGMLTKSDSTMSRKDLIEQLIADSKKRKAEKQKIREQTLDLTEKLDTEWKDLFPLMSTSKTSKEDPPEKVRVDDYDMAVRELKFEARGNPTDRLKSEEEIIKEEKEKLEALEADRLARMKGFITDSSTQSRHKSADDLDDGFVVEKISEEAQNDKINNDVNALIDDGSQSSNDSNDSELDEDANEAESEVQETNESLVNDKIIKNKIDKKSKTQNDKHEESDEDETQNSNSTDDEDSSEDDLSDLKELDSSSENEEEIISKKTVKFGNTTIEKSTNSKTDKLKSILKSNKETEVKDKVISEDRKQEIRNDLLKRKEVMEKARKELPYTYKAPENFTELQKLLQNQNPDYQSVIVDRIIKCNHWSLDSQNKEKLSNLFIFLIEHILVSSIEDSNVENIVNSFQSFDRLCPYLYDLAHANPESTKNSMIEIIKKKYEEFKNNKKQYPNIDTLIIFKLVSLLFSTSDFRHVIVTPCFIFMSQILMTCRVKNRRDISRGLFICTLILEYTVLSKRFDPSVINFLRGLIFMATPKNLIQGIKVIPPFKQNGYLSNLLIIDQEETDVEMDLNTVIMKANDLVNEDIDNDFKIRTLFTAVNLITEFKNQLQELDSVYSIFEPIMKLLKENPCNGYPSSLKKNIKQLCEEIINLKSKKLEYIVREKKRPKPLRQYEPRIEKVYDGKKHKPMSKEKAEREKLLHKYKRETKGAIREIRRDRAFLSKLQIKQQIKSDTERKRKVKEIFGDAAKQQSELKKLKRK